MSNPALQAHERRIEHLERENTSSSTAIARIETVVAGIDEKLDHVVGSLDSLSAAFQKHGADDQAVEKRVIILEQGTKKERESAKERRDKAWIFWGALITVAGDALLQVLTHFHLLP